VPQRTIATFHPPPAGAPSRTREPGSPAGIREPGPSPGSTGTETNSGRVSSRTADRGHPKSRDPARYNRGMAALAGNNYSEALAIFTELAKMGDALAEYELAQMYENGWGTPQDYSAAIPYLEQSADAGDADAANDMGMLTADGLGTDADPDASRQWYQKATDLESDQPSDQSSDQPADQAQNASLDSQQASAEPPAEAEGSATKQLLGTIGDWGAYLNKASSGRVCYLEAELQPIPNGENQFPLNLTVTHRPEESSFNVVHFIEPFDQGSDVDVSTNGQDFSLFVKDGAWAATSALDAEIVQALSNGGTVSVTGTYDKAQKTFSYRLAGFRNALRLIDKACGYTR
jgi:Sel1 repeat